MTFCISPRKLIQISSHMCLWKPSSLSWQSRPVTLWLPPRSQVNKHSVDSAPGNAVLSLLGLYPLTQGHLATEISTHRDMYHTPDIKICTEYHHWDLVQSTLNKHWALSWASGTHKDPFPLCSTLEFAGHIPVHWAIWSSHHPTGKHFIPVLQMSKWRLQRY